MEIELADAAGPEYDAVKMQTPAVYSMQEDEEPKSSTTEITLDALDESNVKRSRDSMLRESYMDGCYGWIVVFGAFMVHFFVLGSVYSFGVFLPVYASEFSVGLGLVSWIGSIGTGVMTGLASYSGAWADQYGNRNVAIIGSLFIFAGFFAASFATSIWMLFLFQGLVAGIGFSLSFLSAVTLVGQWFNLQRGLAVGIAVAGSGVGQFALAPITEMLVTGYGFRLALRYLAILIAGGTILSSLLLTRLNPTFSPSPGENLTLFYLKDRNFVFFYLSSLISTIGFTMPFSHVLTFAEDIGISSSDAALLLSVMGICSALGRAIIGVAADYLGALNMLRISIGVGAASIYYWMSCTSFNSLVVFCSFFGFFGGGLISLAGPVCAKLFGIKRLGAVMGLMYTGSAIGNALGAPIGGFLYDDAGNYSIAIPFAASCMMVGLLLSLPVVVPDEIVEPTLSIS